MTHMCPESEEQQQNGVAGAATVHPLAPLNRKRSFVKRPTTIKTPHLQPVTMEPERCATATVPLAFLRTIERIEINETRVRDAVTYYVLDVYLYHLNTRLPTNLNNPQRAAMCASPVKPDKPDHQVERRFSGFRQLRDDVYEMVSRNPQFRCEHCNAFVEYVRFHGRQPSSLAKITTGIEKRKTILSAFINDFLRMAQDKEKQSRKCVPEDLVPHLIESFVRDCDVRVSA